MADPCPPSADSVSVIDSCPMSSSEWSQRALQKNCSMYPQTCFRPLEYHCLLNPYGNESLEVCAPNTWLAEDFCPVFNIKQQRILEQFDCTSLISDCPRRQYNSRSILDYKGCLRELHGLTTSAPNFTPSAVANLTSATPRDTPMDDNLLWLAPIIIILAIILITLLFVYNCWRKGHTCFRGSHQNRDIEMQGLMCFKGSQKKELEDFQMQKGSPSCGYTKYEEIRLVLLGETSSGKSATGNSILGSRDAFVSSLSGRSGTRVCSLKAAKRSNQNIVIVETPGIIFDTTTPNDITQQEMSKCIGITSPGPHAFIFIIDSTSRFTMDNHRVIDLFERHFGENIFQYMFILFTRKDELDRYKVELKDYIEKSPQTLKSLIEKCGGRVMFFDNTLKGVTLDKQTQDLLTEITKNLQRNGCECFTNDIYKKVEEHLQKREQEQKEKFRSTLDI